ncbi:MAG TPA: RNA methyltransferase [Sphingobacteriaceae bacterium]
MLSKSELSFIKSLHLKKFRKEHRLFLAEGIKSVTEFLNSGYQIETIYCTDALAPNLNNISRKIKLVTINETELQKITTLTTPQGVLAIIRTQEETEIRPESFNGTFTLVLDGIQDPGNMGTIIRTADWFGFHRVICSPDCVEVYNPKVVQATMGSLSRTKIVYTDLYDLLTEIKVPVYGAVLNGESIYHTSFRNEGVILLGNEGNGLSSNVLPFITQPITIPLFGHAESLNVAISAGIICYEVKRNVT